jgi:hypothetical protein
MNLLLVLNILKSFAKSIYLALFTKKKKKLWEKKVYLQIDERNIKNLFMNVMLK